MAFLLDQAGGPLTVFDDLLNMQEQFNRFFSDPGGTAYSREYPPIKVWTSEEDLVVDIEAPGIDPKDIDITV